MNYGQKDTCYCNREIRWNGKCWEHTEGTWRHIAEPRKETDRSIKKFCFRAECEHDVNELRKRLGDRITKITVVMNLAFPDVDVEIETILSIEDVKAEMNQVIDGHVMFGTVALKKEYTGIRRFD